MQERSKTKIICTQNVFDFFALNFFREHRNRIINLHLWRLEYVWFILQFRYNGCWWSCGAGPSTVMMRLINFIRIIPVAAPVFCYNFHAMAADDLAMHGVRTSTAKKLTHFSRIIQVSVSDELNFKVFIFNLRFSLRTGSYTYIHIHIHTYMSWGLHICLTANKPICCLR